MGFFTKREHTHVVRDEHGNVIRMERNGDTSGMKTTDQLMSEYREKKPSRLQQFKTSVRERQFEHNMQRANEKEAYQKAYHKARIERHTQLGRQAGSRTTGDRLERFISGPPRRQQPHVVHHYHNAPPRYNKQPKKKHHPQQKRRQNPFSNLDVFDNWGLLK